MQKDESKSKESKTDASPLPPPQKKIEIPVLPVPSKRRLPPIENSKTDLELKDPSVYNSIKKCVNIMISKRKLNVKNYIRTWNILDTKLENEIIETEHNKKKLTFRQAALATFFTVKSKTSNQYFISYTPIPVPDDYDGVKIEFPLEITNVMNVLESIQEGIHSSYVMKVIHELGKYYLHQPNIQTIDTETNRKITVVGDLHGQLKDLFQIFQLNDLPSPNNIYIFNGDFVDRGINGVEIFFILSCFKLLYPNSVFLNRGNHESMSMNLHFGFRDEVYMKYPECKETMFRLFSDVFNTLSLATLINNRVFVVHGGIGGLMDVSMKKINEINRFREVPLDRASAENEIFECLLWSDPRPNNENPDIMNEYFRPSSRGAGYEWSYYLSSLFCLSNCLNYIVRSHECVAEGYELVHQNLVITIFSASFYCNANNNKGSFLKLDNSLNPQIQQYYSEALDKTDISHKMKSQVENLKNDVLEKLKEIIVTHKADLYEWYQQVDKTKSGYITKYEWAYSLYDTTKLEIPFISYVKKLAKIEKNGKIKYNDFLDRYILDVKGLDKSWYEDTLRQICKKLLLACSSLTRAFEKFDKNGDGAIDYNEFVSVIKSINLNLSKRQIYELMVYLDSKRDNKIHYREFADKVKITFSDLKTSNRNDSWIQSSFSKIGEALFSTKTPLKQIFDEFDENKDSQLNQEEFIKAIKKFNLDFSENDLIKIYNAVDVDSSGLLNYEEFTNAFQISLNDLIYGYRVPENLILELYKNRKQLQSLFKYADRNNEHKLKNDVFFQVIQTFAELHDLPFTSDHINDIINYMDQDEDGFIDYYEFSITFQVIDMDA